MALAREPLVSDEAGGAGETESEDFEIMLTSTTTNEKIVASSDCCEIVIAQDGRIWVKSIYLNDDEVDDYCDTLRKVLAKIVAERAKEKTV